MAGRQGEAGRQSRAPRPALPRCQQATRMAPPPPPPNSLARLRPPEGARAARRRAARRRGGARAPTDAACCVCSATLTSPRRGWRRCCARTASRCGPASTRTRRPTCGVSSAAGPSPRASSTTRHIGGSTRLARKPRTTACAMRAGIARGRGAVCMRRGRCWQWQRWTPPTKRCSAWLPRSTRPRVSRHVLSAGWEPPMRRASRGNPRRTPSQPTVCRAGSVSSIARRWRKCGATTCRSRSDLSNGVKSTATSPIIVDRV
mmetsp:Transcript_6792/g.22436  ORF Transcript_6792/g.22436 Transcript_6792/m.22436 type:complete len:260 (+) Transcript_6792:216-995(+)